MNLRSLGTEALERRATRCRACRGLIIFGLTEAGRFMPVDFDPPADGSGTVVVGLTDRGQLMAIVDEPDEGRRTSHFATCPEASSFRRRS